jgi:hypothetical protein
VTNTAIRCTSCHNLKGDININSENKQIKIIDAMGIPSSLPNALELAININPENKQIKIIDAMGIPSSLPNALELAEAHLESLKKKERTLKKIEEIIDSE